ncbi:galactosylceramide sulfotransferase-like [Ptychodera flava]|uniref:galactosylceramide sulfotransferase-like n=1 Tax=Ptychodera flava TaxID=63121 RepID=UPI003969E2A2
MGKCTNVRLVVNVYFMLTFVGLIITVMYISETMPVIESFPTFLRKIQAYRDIFAVKHAPCKEPKTKIVFLKTYKTASTTVSAMLMRYGYYHNLSFVLPLKSPVFSRVKPFNRNMMKEAVPPLPSSNGTYDVHAIHVPFNKSEFAAVIHNATYVTIIRHPVSQFESTFGFYKAATRIKSLRKDSMNGSRDPLSVFLMDPKRHYNSLRENLKVVLRNRQIFDFGLKAKDFDNDTRVGQIIDAAAKEFDLVMISEYFDESLLLLRRLLCWKFDDILYILQNKRSGKLRFSLDAWKSKQILEWNKADYKLYKHFNATFWRKVAEYGSGFQDDLRKLRRMLDDIRSDCLDVGRHKIAYQHRRNVTMLKKNATSYCKIMNWDADVGTAVLRKRQMKNNSSSS